MMEHMGAVVEPLCGSRELVIRDSDSCRSNFRRRCMHDLVLAVRRKTIHF